LWGLYTNRINRIAMKWVQLLLLWMLIASGINATAQQRTLNIGGQERLRLRDLDLTLEQKRRLASLIQRERMQFYMNQKELNEILTEKQKLLLLKWRERRFNRNDSTTFKN
jgi:hypothetical protein